MEQQNTTSEVTQDAAFKQRRRQKNWIVMGLVMASVALVWSVTMIKVQKGMVIAHPIGISAPLAPQIPHNQTSEGKSNAQ